MVDDPNRDVNSLRPDFREKLEAWLTAVRQTFPGYEVGVHEARRTPERQAWLFASGRSRPGAIVTNTLDSNHLYGIAADWHFSQAGRALWDASLYERALTAVPPERFGLEDLRPFEYVHIQLADADNRRAEPAPPPVDDSPQDRLLIVYRGGVELERYALAPDAEIVRRDSPDGSRTWLDLNGKR